MSADISAFIQIAAIVAIPIVIAITFHEAAHGFVAWRCGDDTAYRLGRVTFNPLKHIDPIGTIVLPLFLYLSTGFMFGYAKPVPVNFRRLRNPRRDMVLVAAAGPATNILLAFASAILLRIFPEPTSMTTAVIGEILQRSIILNIILAVFNMIPLPPLDGGRVAVGLLPYPLSLHLARLERYGMPVLIGLLIVLPWIGSQMGVDLHIVQWIIGPVAQHIAHFILWVTGNVG
ncbi:MAG TPA: site-2 protease family protein [Alphaproteobacteria bacterium]|nr:site-2 protease family protein [Alphaproteobacteria bacterium]